MATSRALSILISVITVLNGLSVDGAATERPRKTPNLHVDVSAATVNALVQCDVDRTERVHETIQDVPGHGIARTVGKVRAELVPDAHAGVVDVVFAGNIWTDSVGSRRTILIHTATTTAVEVRRRVVFTEHAILLLAGPCRAEATTHLLGVTSQMDMDAAAIALNKHFFQHRKSAAEFEIADKTAKKISDRLGDELTPPLESARKAIGGQVKEFNVAGVALESLRFSTSAAFLQAHLRYATPGQADINPTPPLPTDIDAGMRIHESLVNEIARAAMGGKTFKISEVNQFYDATTLGFIRDGRNDAMRKDGLKKLEDLLGKIDRDGTAIHLAARDPVTVAFTAHGFTVEIHIDSIRQGNNDFQGMRVKGTYALENTTEGVHAVRKGAVRIELIEDERKLGPQPATFAVAREALFAEVFKDRIALAAPLPTPLADLRFEPARAGSRDGWLGLVWYRTPSKK
ncbi:MAG: hypothetical protein HY289_11400 [Planctomycetes bacterium]|nr:hypothetical protein [Planctomycetota bacterium]